VTTWVGMLASLSILVVCVGIGVFALGSLWLILEAFREHVGWGIAVLLLPVATLAFLVLAWQRAKPAFLCQLYGVLIMVGGMIVTQALHHP
jgi:hypothetical protein